MWDWNDDYTEAHHVKETPHGIFRAVVVRDDYPHEPYNEYGYPIFRINPRYYSTEVERVEGYGYQSWMHDGISDAEYALSKFITEFGVWEGIEVFNRFLRVFHGGSAESYDPGYHSDYLYVAYDTRAMREFFGQTGEWLETSKPELDEWRAFIEGEVYGVRVDRAVDFDEDGNPDEWAEVEDTSVWGFYGDEWAKEAALESLRWTVESVAADMLPLNA